MRSLRAQSRKLDRLFWVLALSGLSQVDHAARRLTFQRVSKEELRNAAVLGLYKAAQRFEPQRGLRFSTYCRYWVRDAMGEAVGTLEYAARLPSKARRQLRAEAQALSPKQAQALERVRHAVELDAPRGDEGEPMIGTLTSPTPSPEVLVIERRQLGQLQRALASAALKPRDRRILAGRFGLQDAPIETCRTLGDELGVSGERVRQLQKAAVKKLASVYAA